MNVRTQISGHALDALKESAAKAGRSLEDEASFLLQIALLDKLPLGTALFEFGRLFDITSEFDDLRDSAPPRIAVFD